MFPSFSLVLKDREKKKGGFANGGRIAGSHAYGYGYAFAG